MPKSFGAISSPPDYPKNDVVFFQICCSYYKSLSKYFSFLSPTFSHQRSPQKYCFGLLDFAFCYKTFNFCPVTIMWLRLRRLLDYAGWQEQNQKYCSFYMLFSRYFQFLPNVHFCDTQNKSTFYFFTFKSNFNNTFVV